MTIYKEYISKVGCNILKVVWEWTTFPVVDTGGNWDSRLVSCEKHHFLMECLLKHKEKIISKHDSLFKTFFLKEIIDETTILAKWKSKPTIKLATNVKAYTWSLKVCKYGYDTIIIKMYFDSLRWWFINTL